ncbi:helix-turn-helix domain-containing protein [Deinococcus sp. UYEF24]
MNDEIRAAVTARLEDKHMSRADLARAVGKTPQEITRALNGGRNGGGKVPGIWAAILEALDLELTAQPRTPGEEEG